MSVIKRIVGERMSNENLTGRRNNPELAAMYAIWQASRKPPEPSPTTEDNIGPQRATPSSLAKIKAETRQQSRLG